MHFQSAALHSTIKDSISRRRDQRVRHSRVVCRAPLVHTAAEGFTQHSATVIRGQRVPGYYHALQTNVNADAKVNSRLIGRQTIPPQRRGQSVEQVQTSRPSFIYLFLFSLCVCGCLNHKTARWPTTRSRLLIDERMATRNRPAEQPKEAARRLIVINRLRIQQLFDG